MDNKKKERKIKIFVLITGLILLVGCLIISIVDMYFSGDSTCHILLKISEILLGIIGGASLTFSKTYVLIINQTISFNLDIIKPKITFNQNNAINSSQTINIIQNSNDNILIIENKGGQYYGERKQK